MGASFSIDLDEVAATFGCVLWHIAELRLFAGASGFFELLSGSLIPSIVRDHFGDNFCEVRFISFEACSKISASQQFLDTDF